MEDWLKEVENHLKLSAKQRMMVSDTISNKVKELKEHFRNNNMQGYDISLKQGKIKINLKEFYIGYEEVVKKIKSSRSMGTRDGIITQEEVDETVEQLIFEKIKENF